jgi:GntR family transcriptional regulator / MocR family aminotransferase
MRQSRGVLLPPVLKTRLRRGDLYGALRTALLDGALAPGERLPSTRQAAADYGVSRGLMEEIFAQLTDEGFLDRFVGRGTFVAPAVSRLRPSEPHREQGAAEPSARGRSIASMAACREPSLLRPFNAGIADTSEFPWKIWQQLHARAARELDRAALNFADPRGLPQLRSTLAHYLAQFRGIRCRPAQVIVFNSAQQALHVLSLLLLNPGDGVSIEDPCYLGARAAFQLAGAALLPVPVDRHGMRVEWAARRFPRARLAYVTPSHQYPTGVALSLDRRLELIEWAARNHAWIVEDDYDGEFRYQGQPLTALHSLDSGARVLYIGTLNKSMFVSLRIAYAVVPEELVEPLANIRTQMDGFTSPARQMAMSLFMNEGHFSSHLRRMRAIYGARRAALVAGLAPLAAAGWTWPDNPAGMHLLASHQDGARVRALAASSPLELALLGSYRVAKHRDDGLLLRFGALDDQSLHTGIASLLTAARKQRSGRG